ncbi:MAG TPA: hypothetical protein VGL56_03615 [Fimbriimonadaceae bacterium]|jgi:hypothetical protein
MRAVISALALSLFALVGCGGGGGSVSATNPTPTGQTITVGQGTVSYEGQTKPTVSAFTAVKTLSSVVTGATLTSFNYQPISSSEPNQLLVAADGVMYLLQDGVFTPISGSSTGLVYSAQFTPTGQIIYIGLDQATHSQQIFVCYADGTGARKLTNSGRLSPLSIASVSPDGLHIIADTNPDAGIVEFTSTGGNEALISNEGTAPFWAPDSNQICFSTPQTTIATAPVSSKTNTPVSVFYPAYDPTWSPDGKEIAYLVDDPNTTNEYNVEEASYDGVTLFGDIPSTVRLPAIQPAFSPDGKYLDYVQTDGTTPRYIYQATWNDQNPTLIATRNPGSTIGSIGFKPFDKPRNLINSSGVVASATGFLLNQTTDGQFASFAAITASPANSTKITQINPGTTGAPIYELSGTTLTSLAYINGYNLARQIVTLPASTPSALVTVNPNTGQLTAVAPFVKRPAISAASSSTALTGTFSGIYDGKGNLRASTGLHTITIDSKTGFLLKVQ